MAATSAAMTSMDKKRGVDLSNWMTCARSQFRFAQLVLRSCEKSQHHKQYSFRARYRHDPRDMFFEEWNPVRFILDSGHDEPRVTNEKKCACNQKSHDNVYE